MTRFTKGLDNLLGDRSTGSVPNMNHCSGSPLTSDYRELVKHARNIYSFCV